MHFQFRSAFKHLECTHHWQHFGEFFLWADPAIIINIFILQNNVVTNIFPADKQMKIPILQKPNSSLIFTGRKDILNKLGKIFAPHTDSRQMSRCSCLLWGLGGIGKTQICLRFTEEMEMSNRQVCLYCHQNHEIIFCSRFSYIFWVDASSQESIATSLKGLSNISTAQASGVDGSVESVLKWISCITEEWLIVFDNADNPSPEVVAGFIPSDRKSVV